MTKTLKKTALAALVAAGALAVTVGSASAYVVCNGEGECWHVHDQYTYPTGNGVIVHDDAWKWDEAGQVHYRWHEHDGRGYWHNGLWVAF